MENIAKKSELSFERIVFIILPAIIVSVPIIGFFYVALSRAAYPFQLEWIESSLYLNVMRILQGKFIYGPPSAEFVPALYTPFYYYASSVFALLTGNIMFSMRIVSILATVIAGISIYGICDQLGFGFVERFLAVGIFFASYKVAGFYYDLGRVDNLALGLAILGSWLALRQKNRYSYGFLIGIILGAAFLTKQHALLSAGFLLIYLGFRKEWKTAIGLALTLLILIAGYYWFSFLTTGDWTFFYTITIPSSSPIQKRRLLVFLKDLFVPTYWPLLVIILVALVIFVRKHHISSYVNQIVALACIVVPMGIFGVGTYIKIWGYINGLGGVAVAIGLITAFCIHFIRTGPPSLIPVPALRFTSFGFILLLFSWQFWMLRYDPRSQIPSWQAAQDGYQLVEQIKKLPRPVYTPAASYMLDMAGLPTNYHISQYADISLGAHYNAKVKAIYELYDFEVTNPLNSGYYQSAIMPNGDYYDAFFNEESGYVCQDFSEPILRSIDGATTFLKGICAKSIGSTP